MADRLASNPKFQAPNLKQIPNTHVQMTNNIYNFKSQISQSAICNFHSAILHLGDDGV